MRWLCFGSLGLLVACGVPEVQSQKLKDGSWSFTCQLSMDECVRRVQEQCKNQRYRILEGTSETRLRDAPPFERAYHTSRLHLVCNDDGANVLLSVSSSPDAAAKPSSACAAGETRECVGPGARKGGQACAADGKSFGSCDCGTKTATPPPADVTPPSAPQPVSTGDAAISTPPASPPSSAP